MTGLLLAMVLVEGFVLMGFEILSSRYLHPYFGSGIDTWASLISTVLMAMMCGYVLGGALADRARTTGLLTGATLLAATYLVATAFVAKDVLLWMVTRFEHTPVLLIGGAAMVLFIPVMLLSAWAPFLVRVLLQSPERSGRVAGMVYGVATLGNVLGALITAFVFIPRYGVFAITLGFAALLLALAVASLLLRGPARRMMAGRAGPLVILAGQALAGTGDQAASVERYLADYPEGVFFDATGDLYFTEMALGRVRLVDGPVDRVFWQAEDCGPTGITRIGGGRFAVACHIVPSIVILDGSGKEIARLTRATDGEPFAAPNDINGDGTGGAFFSDSGVFHPSAPATGKLFHIDRNFTVTRHLSGLRYANGVAVAEDGQVVYVSEHLGRRILKVDLANTAPPEIWIDFAERPETAALMLGFAGPDGLRLTEDGGLLIALYGTGRVAMVSRCRDIALLGGFNRYVTSVGRHGRRMAVASAGSNAGPDFGGDVRILNIDHTNACAR